MLLSIPDNTELIVATSTGVKTFRNGDDLNSDQLQSGEYKILGMQLRKDAKPTVTTTVAGPALGNIRFGNILFNFALALIAYQHYGAIGLLIFAFVWMIADMILLNTKREVKLLQHSAQSSTSTPGARSAQDRSTN